MEIDTGQEVLGKEESGSDTPTLSGYRFTRLLGKGAMGSVHLAWDETLGRHVAIKALAEKLEVGSDAEARFLREARAMATVEHPCVIRIYSFRTEVNRPFIVMEYVQGETLSQLLASHGKLPVDEALQIIRQVAEGLEAAWEKGVIHRDIKPSNILIDQRGHVRVADFGLAKPTQDPKAPELTLEGSFQGTPHYMAPEQALGEEVDWRSDVYSLSVVLYELLTGKRPFHGNLLSIVTSHMDEAFPPLVAETPGVPPEVEDLISKMSQKDPDHRHGSYKELLAELDSLLSAYSTQPIKYPSGISTISLPKSPLIRYRRRRQLLRAAAVTAALILIVLGLRYFGPFSEDNRSQSAINMRTSVAVLGFKNLSPQEDNAWMSTAIAEMLSVELAAGGKLKTIAPDNVARSKLELSLSEGEPLTSDTLSKVGTLLAADYLVMGSYLVVPGGAGMRINVIVQDTSTGEIVAAETESGDTEDILAMVARVGERLRTKLGAGDVTTSDNIQARAAMPATQEALRLYAQGLELKRSFQYMEAKDLLSQAIVADPEYPLAYAALAEVWCDLGYDGKAAEQAGKAAQLSQNLPNEEQRFVEARDHEMSGRWDEAIESYNALHKVFPDNVDYGLRLAGVLTTSGQGEKALETVFTLRQLPAPACNDVRITLAEAIAAGHLSDHQLELEASSVAIRDGEALGASLLVATAQIHRGHALLRLGEPDMAEAAISPAIEVFDRAGDSHGKARALNLLATIAFEQGDYASAQSSFEQVLELWRNVGNLDGTARALNNIGDSLMAQGKLSAAKTLFERAVENARVRGDTKMFGVFQFNLANLALKQGDLAAARTIGEGALQLTKEGQYDYASYGGLTYLGWIFFESGDLDAATKFFEEGLGLARSRGSRLFVGRHQFGLGSLAMAAGDLEQARLLHEQALANRKTLGYKNETAQSQVALAKLTVEEDRSLSDLAPLQQAIEVFEALRMKGEEAYAWLVMAEVRRKRGETEQAWEATLNAQRRIEQCHTIPLQLRVRSRLARQLAAGDRWQEAEEMLAATAARAGALGLVVIELETRLAQAEVTALRGGAPDPHIVDQLHEEARERKLNLIADKAAALMLPASN
jgi:serine/threonine protein kinase/tetratricopeptide (TPR) repeat protein